jgi:hypothetical protein
MKRFTFSRVFHVCLLLPLTLLLGGWQLTAPCTTLSSTRSSEYLAQVSQFEFSDQIQTQTHSNAVTISVAALEPILIGSYNTPGKALGVTVDGGYAYIADGEAGGLRVIDVSNPTAPIETGSYETPHWARNVTVRDQYAYVADTQSGLRIVDVSDPSNPTEVGVYDTSWDANDIALVDDYAYVADGGAGLKIIDISTPVSPSKVGSTYAYGYSASIDVVSDYAYVAYYESYWPSDESGLFIANISDPINPFEESHYTIPGELFEGCKDVTVVGNYAYVVNTVGGLHIVNVSNPQNPVEVGTYPTSGAAKGVTVKGDYAFVAAGDAGLRIVDVSDPTNPTEVSSYDTSGHTYGVSIAGNYIYLADGKAGLWVLRYPPYFYISGLALDDNSNPIEGVQITVGNEYSATTNVNGQYTVTEVLSGTYSLAPNKPGCFFEPTSRIINVPPDATGQDFEGFCEFDISGYVRGVNGHPISGVAITTNSDGVVTTNDTGTYTISDLISGTHTLTPTRPGWVFAPPTRTVTVPPNATGQDFTMLSSPVSTTLTLSGTANLPNALTYTNTQGLTTTFTFPRGAVTETTTIVVTPTVGTSRGDLAFAGHAFDLEGYQGGEHQIDFTVDEPVTVTIHYSEKDTRLVSDESQLTLRWWDGGAWRDAAETCDQPSAYARDVSARVLSVPICHLSRFALLGPVERVYLPVVLRSH